MVACAPSTPPFNHINQFLVLVSPKSPQSRIKLHCSDYLSHSLHDEIFANAPNHFHLLIIIFSSQTSYPLISLCWSTPHNCLLNWEFNICIKHKLHIPLYSSTNQPVCACGMTVDIFGDHAFKCTHTCKIGVHNTIRDGFARALAPASSMPGYIPPKFTVNMEPLNYLPSDPHSCPFDISFNPYSTLPPPLTSHGCTSTTIGGKRRWRQAARGSVDDARHDKMGADSCRGKGGEKAGIASLLTLSCVR